MKMILVGLILIFVLIIGSVSALPTGQQVRVSSEIGENYVQWGWKSVNSSVGLPPVDIYIDDSQTAIEIDYMESTYLSDDLIHGSRHNIALYNATARSIGQKELLGKATAMTLKPAYEYYFLIAAGLFLMVLTFFMQELIRLVLISVVNIIICLFGMSISGLSLISYAFIGIAVITGVILLIIGIPKLREEISWG